MHILYDFVAALIGGFIASQIMDRMHINAARKAELAKTVFDFARNNFDTIKDKQGFITMNSLYIAEKRFPEHHAELRFLSDNLSKFGHVIAHYDVAITSPAGGFVAHSQLFGATRSELDNLAVTVSPKLGIVKIRRV